MCKCYDAGGHYLFNDLIGVTEPVNALDGARVSIRHQLNVRWLEHCIADEWNYRGHGPPFGFRGFHLSQEESVQN
jgi:hypothetical protein